MIDSLKETAPCAGAGPDRTTPDYAPPLVIAVTGHRDLVESQVPQIREQVKRLMVELKTDYPQNRLVLMSPLAEGADQLAAEVALELGVELLVPLPKERQSYIAGFGCEAGRIKFTDLCARAAYVFELAHSVAAIPPGIDPAEWEDSFPYINLGTYICAHCHILLAIWDGKDSDQLGGTAQVVKFHHDDTMPGLRPDTSASQQLLVDDESDLVYHIPCDRSGSQTAACGASPSDWCWYTKDIESPRTRVLPAQHRLIFQRIAEFGNDARRHAEDIEGEKDSLLDSKESTELPAGVRDIDHFYCTADRLAVYYQKKSLRTLAITHTMAFLMGLMFILYSDMESLTALMLAFLGFFAIASASQFIARRRAWHRKYLDYRALAEGLRVQFYWAAAGVTSEDKWKFAHDSYQESQNPEFGWIRNVMRVAGIRCDARPNVDPAGLDYAIQGWVGGDGHGQLGYFRNKTRDRVKRFKLTERLGNLSLTISILSVFAFLLAGPYMGEFTQALLTVVMGSTLLLYGVRKGYTYATATKELIKQYELMLRIFDNAHRRLSASNDVEEQRKVLAALGQSALDEHSDWILMHRERSPDENKVWHMSG